MSSVPATWSQPDQDLVSRVAQLRRNTLDAYRADPLLVTENARQEDSFRTGGYADRQILELVQNAADALLRADRRGRVEVHLTDAALYCANEGEPFTRAGLEAVSHAYISEKRGDEIGRFGLGFKSVLGVSSQPTIFSRSVSFGFDAATARADLATIAPSANAFPILRLPTAVDAGTTIADDPLLAELAEWATTIVKLPLPNAGDGLATDLVKFRREFLLFARNVDSLHISVNLTGGRTEPLLYAATYGCSPNVDDRVTVTGGDRPDADWLVVDQMHRPSPDALAEVGEALRRDEVRVSYAVPVDDAVTLGQFWAHFPLQDQTSTRGIHNAPWRINDDRTTLLDGRFNRELLDVVADLVAENVHRLRTTEDPARHLDFMPARGREAHNTADRYLAQIVPAKMRERPSVPDADRNLRRPDQLLYLRADIELDLKAYRQWDAAPGRPVDSPHWTCYKGRDRRARLRSLMRLDDEKPTNRELSPAAWIERIAATGADDQVESALRIVSSVTDDSVRRLMATARILPDTTGGLHRLNAHHELFLRGNILSSTAGLKLVRASLLDRGEVTRWLNGLGFSDVDPQQELRKLASVTTRNWTSQQWIGFWELVDDVSNRDAEEILVEHASAGATLKVLCADGRWHDIGTAVVTGTVHPIDKSLTVDDSYHGRHAGLLAALGVSARPVASAALKQDSTFLEYVRLHREAFLNNLPPRGRPPVVSLVFREQVPVGPLHVLRRFTDTHDTTAAEIWTAELLAVDGFEQWHLDNLRNRGGGGAIMRAPHLWAAQRYGLLRSSWGPRPPARCLGPNLGEYADLLPVAADPAAAKLTTINSLDEISVDLWREFLNRPAAQADPWRLGALLVSALAALGDAEPPEHVPAASAETGLVQRAGLLVAVTQDEVRALAERRLPHVAVTSQAGADTLVGIWECLPASSTLRVEIVTETPGQPVILLDRFHGLREIADGRLDSYELVLCSDLARQVIGPDGTESEVADYLRTATTIYYVDTLPDEELLARIASDFDLPITTSALQRVLIDADSARVKRTVVLCRAATTIADKLQILLPEAALKQALPSGLLESVRDLGQDSGAAQVADLVWHVHGYSVLYELRFALEKVGYRVPERWSGSAPAVAFVRSLGLAVEFAGVQNSSLASERTVLGPPRLAPLHDYQEDAAAQIRRLVAVGSPPQRALLFLPTGAGKTRVTVEAMTKAFIEDGLRGPLLWIAQTEELCEQAVQTWDVVWREFGDRPLRVCRLWSQNEVANSDDTLTVVVATDAKLEHCRDHLEYEWLRDASAVVIDEAHTATESGIDATLRWLGLGNRDTARPLLGLTATPFKGTGPEANRRLANRFGDSKIDVLGDDPYGELQRRGVLARIEHRVLDGMSVELGAAEARQFTTFRRVPATVLERVGRDEERSRRLLESIETLPPEWPVLVFTASVLSAQVLAALLRVRGIPAASISGSTRTYDRRHNIDAFRRGELRVLTNCNVLTQGFDAPAVRALYIARPTFSPNNYIQMVGRGLRGPANGGKSECLVVNIADTFGQFGDKLAYREFDYLWNVQGGTRP